MTEPILAILLFGIPSALGIRATYRLWRLYLFDDESRQSVILLSYALIASLITIAAIFNGVLVARRLLGWEALPWSPPISLIIAGVILLIPAALERLVSYVGGRPPRDI